MEPTAPAIQVIVEMLNDDTYTFGPEDMIHTRTGGVLGYMAGDDPEALVEAASEPDGFIEFGASSFIEPENEWEDPDPALHRYSRKRIFSRCVSALIVVYDEPGRMDLLERLEA